MELGTLERTVRIYTQVIKRFEICSCFVLDYRCRMNSVLSLYQDNLQSGRLTNGVRHFKTNSQNTHAGYKEV